MQGHLKSNFLIFILERGTKRDYGIVTIIKEKNVVRGWVSIKLVLFLQCKCMIFVLFVGGVARRRLSGV